MEQVHADLAGAAAAAPDDPVVTAWQAFLYVVEQKEEMAAAAEKRLLERLEILRQGRRGWPGVGSVPLSGFGMPPEASAVGAGSAWWPALEEELIQHLAKDAKAVPLLRLRGLERAGQGNWDLALPDFQEVLRLEPKDIVAAKGVVCVNWRTYRPAPWGLGSGSAMELLDACDVVLGLDPEAWDFWYLRGLICVEDGHSESAIKAYTMALKLHPDFAPLLRDRGTVYAGLGKWPEAVADFGRAAELNGPADATLLDSLALAQLLSPA